MSSVKPSLPRASLLEALGPSKSRLAPSCMSCILQGTSLKTPKRGKAALCGQTFSEGLWNKMSRPFQVHVMAKGQLKLTLTVKRGVNQQMHTLFIRSFQSWPEAALVPERQGAGAGQPGAAGGKGGWRVSRVPVMAHPPLKLS